MKHLILLLSFIFSSSQLKSQCFEIQSILVDACAGSQEGQNEMVTFQVGSTALNTANLSVNWPNNSWLGLTKNAGTAADVATVNSTILGCGFLKEPTAGVLPPNAKVLLVTSAAWTPLAQSFVNLTDTFFIIFQTAGNTAGHFANFQAGGGLRTLTMSFSSPAACNDAVTYDRALLLKQNLTVGAQDGGAVEFSSAGVATYVNNGCQAPYIPLSVNAGPDKTICLGSSQSFSATSSGVYTSVNWSLGLGATGSFSPTNSLSTSYTPGVGEVGTIKLYCNLLKVCGTQTTTVKDSVSLTILQVPNPVLSATTNTLCVGNSSTLSYSLTNAANSGTISTLWLPGNATSSSLSVNSANIYTVQVSNLCGSKTATISITSIPNPSVSLSNNSPSACAGATVALSATSTVGNFSWSNPVSTNSAVVISATTTTTGVVTTTNACGSDSKTFTLTITPTPTINVSNASVNLCTGQSATITASSNVPSYTWSPGGVNTNSIVLNSAGAYTVEVSNICGNSTATVNVVVTSVPTISMASTSSSICASGQTVTLSLSGSSGTYLWSNGANTSTTTVNVSGIYTATVTTPSCGTATTSITLGVIPLPTVSISVPSTSVCTGSALTFTANSSDANYLWSGGITTQTISVNTSSIIVTTTNSCGSTQATQTINIVPLPTVTVSPTVITLCTGQSATVQATSNEVVSYFWNTGATTSSVSLNAAGVYTVNASNACGNALATVTVSISSAPTLSITSSVVTMCPSGQTATLSLAGSTGTYSWNTGVSTPTTLISSPGVYSATVSTPGCGSTVANISLGSAPLPVVSISAPITTTLCAGGSVILTATSNEGNYLWSNGATTFTVSANTPTISVTSTNSCGSSQATQTLNVIPLPTVIITPTSNILCPGTSATLTATSNVGNFQWNTGDNTATIFVNTTGVKTVTVSNVCGTATASANISSISFPPLILTSTSNTICPNETATLTVTGGVPLTTGSPILYSWSNSSSTNSIVTTNGGIISVSNTNVCGTTTASVLVSVVNLNASIAANPTSGVAPITVDFTNNSTNAISYLWNFGNGNVANTQTVSSQVYNVPGTYTAYLTITNGVCTDIDSIVINVLEEGPTLYVPNAFTPNGDSINDFFIVGATKIKEFHIIIFDRWGLKMFESSDIYHGWDGKINGKEVADGTYFHLINAKGNDDVEIKKQGTITLFK